MEAYKRDFLKLAMDCGALKFGEFELKSGRISPYFFNLGAISSGKALLHLARCYAQALTRSGLAPDGLFGPAYKGIPLVTAVACALAEKGQDLPITYNRKEAKDHGEGGHLVGAELRGRIVVIDDVITAGTAVREAIGIIEQAGARPAGLLVALDRQEKAEGEQSAIQALAEQTGVATLSICGLDDVMDFMRSELEFADELRAMEAYRAEYGVHAA
jgi:orotate phosphoribosyltransferase